MFSCDIYCIGDSSCANAAIEGYFSTDVNVLCSGSDSCKSGFSSCGSGGCTFQCGTSAVDTTACEDHRVRVGSANKFACSGFCPTTFPPNFSGAPTPSPSRYEMQNQIDILSVHGLLRNDFDHFVALRQTHTTHSLGHPLIHSLCTVYTVEYGQVSHHSSVVFPHYSDTDQFSQ